MDQSKLKYKIFDLRETELAALCADLLKAEFEFEGTYNVHGVDEKGYDILAIKDNKQIAIQVKHKFNINKDILKKDLKLYEFILSTFSKFIYITSARIDKNLIKEFESERISILSQNEIFNLLDKYSDIADRYFTIVEQKNKSVRKWFTTSIAGVMISILASLFMLVIDTKDNNKPLSNRIENVEQALQNIKGLEKDLEGIKDDMIKTEIENKRILEEYEKMQGLEEFINEKKESLNLVLNYEPWYKKLLNYTLGLITGIFSSIIASILWSKWKLNISLKE